MKKLIIIILVTVAGTAAGQNKILPTDTLRVLGQVKKEMLFTLSLLDTFKKTAITGVVMVNHKESTKNLKGILLKDLFEKIEFQADNHKALNKFYLIFSASDGFKIVLSWNELFNAETCNNFFLLTEEDGKKIDKMEERISIISVSNSKTVHNRIKGLEKITVKQAD